MGHRKEAVKSPQVYKNNDQGTFREALAMTLSSRHYSYGNSANALGQKLQGQREALP